MPAGKVEAIGQRVSLSQSRTAHTPLSARSLARFLTRRR